MTRATAHYFLGTLLGAVGGAITGMIFLEYRDWWRAY